MNLQEDKNTYIEQILKALTPKESFPPQNKSGISRSQLERLHIVDLERLIRDKEFFEDYIKPIDEDILTQIRSINDGRPTELDLNNKGLKDGQLARILSKIENLSSLQVLALANNQLTALPESFEGLAALWWLDLKNNSLKQ